MADSGMLCYVYIAVCVTENSINIYTHKCWKNFKNTMFSNKQATRIAAYLCLCFVFGRSACGNYMMIIITFYPVIPKPDYNIQVPVCVQDHLPGLLNIHRSGDMRNKFS